MPTEESTSEPDDAAELTSRSNLGEVTQQEKKWVLYVDGASNEEGSGAGVLLISPEGEEMAYALRFNFKATNNEAEYEALITGLKLAQSMQAQRVETFSDSQVVVQQVQGSYEARDTQLKKDLAVVRSLTSSMKDVSVQQVPSSKKKRADAQFELILPSPLVC